MSATIQKVKAISDDDGHWYVVPDDLANEFRMLLRRIYADVDDYVLQNDFNAKFGRYRTGGDLNNIQLYAEL